MSEQSVARTPAVDQYIPASFLQSPCNGWPSAAGVYAVGELDLLTVDELADALRRLESFNHRVLDLRAVTFMDCAALKVVFDANDRAQTAGARFVVIEGPARLDCLFEVTGARHVLNIVRLGPFETAGRALLFHRG